MLWVKTVNGKIQPFDAKPEKRAIIEIGYSYDEEGNAVQTRTAKMVDTYMPHHATCPDVEKYRRPK